MDVCILFIFYTTQIHFDSINKRKEKKQNKIKSTITLRLLNLKTCKQDQIKWMIEFEHKLVKDYIRITLSIIYVFCMNDANLSPQAES